MIAAVLEAAGCLDILVNNAGVPQPISDLNVTRRNRQWLLQNRPQDP